MSLIARARRPALALAASALVLGGLVPAAAAASHGLGVTTPYPSIAVAPGSDASFDLTVTNNIEGTVRLVVLGTPPGWKATLRGGGFVIQGVTVAPNKPGTARLDVSVPADTTVAKADLRVEATSGATVTLPITVLVNADVAGDITLTTNSPTLTGSSESDFSFDLTLQNDTAQDQTVSAKATAPEGWRVATKLADAQAASTVVKAGSSTTITVTATPPANAPAGQTEIDVTATAGSKTIQGKLGVVITGSFEMTLATPNDLISARGPAGSGTTQQVVIRNTGTAPLTNVKLTATTPTKWKVTFDQETVPTVQPDGEVTVTATITPSSEAITGDYKVTIKAEAPGENGATATSADLEMTFTVETSPIWLLAGFGLIIAIVGALFYVFRTYGRR